MCEASGQVKADFGVFHSPRCDGTFGQCGMVDGNIVRQKHAV